jgi:hypothetical protein
MLTTAVIQQLTQEQATVNADFRMKRATEYKFDIEPAETIRLILIVHRQEYPMAELAA